MFCKFAVICKFYQSLDLYPGLKIPETKEECRQTETETVKPEEVVKRHYTRKTLGEGSIKEKPGKGRGDRHCKKCDFITTSQGILVQHYRKEHPKVKSGGKPEKKESAEQIPENGKEAEHAFKSLQKRANKGKLSGEHSDVYDSIEPLIIGKEVKDWPEGAKENIIKLYGDVTGFEEG